MLNDNRQDINKDRAEFQAWKRKVRQRLPDLVRRFYEIDSIKPFQYETHMHLGKMITWINSPHYSLLNDRGKRTSGLEEIADQMILRVFVNELFKLVNKRKG